ncbi:hypothetical protein [Streptomyces sp. NRRL F-2580]|uniref:hypothetical protein n=1 Tax=Streptomyces sp. NRRL F-2580 TaxID=1463841 RepID=UPI0004CC4A0D|nr:hypothetical protein [Streptomyces sp. NRRL F-2580]
MGNGLEKTDALALLAAMVAGDADIRDGVLKLKEDGVSSLEEAIVLLRDGWGARRLLNRGELEPIDFGKMRKKSPPEALARIEHVVPEVPFVVRGVEYEPKDITRFNGKGLHFITTPDSDCMLALDDRDTWVDWMQLLYFERNKGSLNLSRGGEFPGVAHVRAALIETKWYEDIKLDGEVIANAPNRGYARLSKVSRGAFGELDWNDVISSFAMYRTQVATIYDPMNWGDPTWSLVLPYGSLYGEALDLTTYGWNDRASGCATW